METKWIDHMEAWLTLKKRLIERGYTLWQTQHAWDLPEGYRARFMHDDHQIEIITHNQEVAEDIIKSGL